MARPGQATGTFQLAPNEKFLLCPYSPSHQLTNLRLGNHIAKCRSNYNYIYSMGVQGRQVQYSECRYNPAHRLPDPELRWHEHRCSSQFDIVRTNSPFTPKRAEKTPLVLRSMREELEAEELKKSRLHLSKSSTEPDFHGPEDWEYESRFNKHQAPYDPAERLEQDNVCYPRHLLTRTERRNFKTANSLRRSLLEVNLPPPPNQDQELEPYFDVPWPELDP